MQNLLPDQQTNLAGLELLKKISIQHFILSNRIANVIIVVPVVVIAEVVVRPIVVVH